MSRIFEARYFVLSLSLVLSAYCESSLAQTARVPKEQVPALIFEQVRRIESDFNLSLSKDCGNRGCYPRACVYAAHEVVTLRGDQILPGLSGENTPRAATEPQYILTAVNCEYAYEESLPEAEIEALNKRLSTKLSSGVLRVNARGLPIPLGFKPDTPVALIQGPTALVMQRLLDHFSWLLAFAFTLTATLIGLWAWRRLGRDSKEDELRHILLKRKLEAEAAQEAQAVAVRPEAEPAEPAGEARIQLRLAKLEPLLSQKPQVLPQLCLEWLEADQFEELATALLLFSGSQSLELKTGPEHLLKKTAFWRFLDGYLPSLDAKDKMLDRLERNLALRAQLIDPETQQLERFFRYFGPRALLDLLDKSNLEARRALLALAPSLRAAEVLPLLPATARWELAQSFWESNRVAIAALQLWEQGSAGLLDGEMPSSFAAGSGGPSLEVDVVSLLSYLLSSLPAGERASLVPSPSRPWTLQVFYPELLLRLPREQASDILLSSDAVALAHWMATLSAEQQSSILGLLPAAYRQQLKSRAPATIDALQVNQVIRAAGRAYERLRLKGETGLVEQA